jgi:putative flippase GtrA
MLNNNQNVTLLIRYLSSGLFVALFQFAAFIFLLYVIHFSYLWASTLAFGFTIVVSFLVQRGLVFRVAGPRAVATHTAFGVLCINSLFGLGVNCFIMYCGVEFLYASEVFWQIISMIVLAAYNFFFYKFLFRPQPQSR